MFLFIATQVTRIKRFDDSFKNKLKKSSRGITCQNNLNVGYNYRVTSLLIIHFRCSSPVATMRVDVGYFLIVSQSVLRKPERLGIIQRIKHCESRYLKFKFKVMCN